MNSEAADRIRSTRSHASSPVRIASAIAASSSPGRAMWTRRLVAGSAMASWRLMYHVTVLAAGQGVEAVDPLGGDAPPGVDVAPDRRQQARQVGVAVGDVADRQIATGTDHELELLDRVHRVEQVGE